MAPQRLLTVALVWPALLMASQSAVAQQPMWRPYVEAEVRGTSIRALGQGNLFVPLWQNQRSLFFADVRGLWTDTAAAEGNWGLAYRRMLNDHWIAGVYGFYDLRNSELGNEFQQVSFGSELLSVNAGVRVNGYVPDGGVGLAPNLNAAFLQGNNILVRRGEERAYWGADVEAEALLWCQCRDDSKCCSPWSPARLNVELWAAAGLFHFDDTTRGFDNMTGPRLRTELRLYDLPLLGDDSRVVLAGQYEHDDVRGSVGSGMLTVRIPFGPGGGSGVRMTGLNRRMTAPIVRDIDIVTNRGLGRPEPAKIARTGQVVSRAVAVDGNTANPENVIAAAGNNSVVIADGAAGPIIVGGSIVMNNGQVLMGGGCGLTVVGCRTGATATFLAPGTRPTILNPDFGVNTVILTDNTTLKGIDIVGGRNGVFTNDLDVANVHVLNTSVTGADDDGYDFAGFTGVIHGNRALNNGDDGFDFDGDINGTVTNNISAGNCCDGFSMTNIGPNGVFANNRALANFSDGFEFLAILPGGRMTGNVANGNLSDGFDFETNNAGAVFSNNTANNNGDLGYEVTNPNAGTANNNTGAGNTNGGNAFP